METRRLLSSPRDVCTRMRATRAGGLLGGVAHHQLRMALGKRARDGLGRYAPALGRVHEGAQLRCGADGDLGVREAGEVMAVPGLVVGGVMGVDLVLPGEVGGPSAAGERAVAVAEDDPPVPEQLARREVGVALQREGEADVGDALLHLAVDDRRHARAQLQEDVGVVGYEGPVEGDQQVPVQGVSRRHDEPLPPRAHVHAGRLVVERQDGARDGDEPLAGGRERHLAHAAAALDELVADVGLQRPDALAGRALGDEEVLCRGGDGAGLGDGDEGLEVLLAHGHGGSPFAVARAGSVVLPIGSDPPTGAVVLRSASFRDRRRRLPDRFHRPHNIGDDDIKAEENPLYAPGSPRDTAARM